MIRRSVLTGALAMVFRPAGDTGTPVTSPAGQSARRPDQQHRPPSPNLPPAAVPGNTFPYIVIAGPHGSIFVYSPSAGAGNLFFSVAAQTGTDKYGNAYLAGATSYFKVGSVWQSVSLDQAGVRFLSAISESGPWQGPGGVVSIGTSTADRPGVLMESYVEMTGAGTAPVATVNGILYVDGSGNLHYLGPGGTDTQLASS